MKVVGIIAEYNPFHNGHLYQINYAKDVLKADYIIIAMSGDFTQRGTIACLDKHQRTKCALENGADVIFEIPTMFSTSSAKEYASCGVTILKSTNIVNTLLFSAENDSKDVFFEVAQKLISFENNQESQKLIKEFIKSGDTYPEARSKVLGQDDIYSFINLPNNILGLEYSKFIIENKIPMNIEILKRKMSNYESEALQGKLSSATSIRKAYEENEDFSFAVPENSLDLINNIGLLNENDISDMLYYKLISEDDFSIYMDSNRDISDRINKIKYNFVNFTQFANLLKSRNITYTRASRILCHILLNIKNIDFINAKASGYINNLHLLGFSEKGKDLLKTIKKESSLEIITGINNNFPSEDIIASNIFNYIYGKKYSKPPMNELTRKFEMKNIKQF